MRQAFIKRLRAWAARRHGRDSLPHTISRRRVYILPTRMGLMLAFTLTAMLIAGLNYNSNLGLAFAFLMASAGLVTMHHCNRNLLGLQVDVTAEVDAFAGREASFEFVLRNDSNVDRRDIEIRCLDSGKIRCVAAKSSEPMAVAIPVPQRGVIRLGQFELRTLYPFGWFHAWTYVQGSLTAYVAPVPHGNRALPAAEGAGYASRSGMQGDEDFAGLRTYQPGMPLKHMAWKVLARGGDAAVRSYTSMAAQPEWLDWASLEDLDIETRLSQLCLWVLESEAAQHVYGLRIPGREIPPSRGAAHRFACLRALAVYGFAEPS
jgi:uncharacterized protein (DUF58 family)